MDTRTLLDNLHDELSCPVCSVLFKDPRQLSCLHSFCLRCLEHWHSCSGSGNAIRCPTCQTLSRVPRSGDLKDLPISFFLNGLIDVLAIKECNTTHVTCENCGKKSSEASYCFQCCRFYCEQCLIAHNIWRDNKDHRVLAVKEFRQRDYEDVLKRPAFCSKSRHDKKKLKFFCKDCKTAACQTCVTLEHSGHALEHVEDEADRQRTELRDIIEAQKKNLGAKQNIFGHLNESKARLTQQGEAVKRHVQTFTDNLMAAIEARKQNIFAAVENQTKRSIENLTAETTKIENEIKVIETSLEKAEKLLTRTASIEFLQLKPSLETIFEGIVRGDSVPHHHESLTVLVFRENQKMLDTITREEIGFLNIIHRTNTGQSTSYGQGLTEAVAGRETQFNLTRKDDDGRQCYSERDQVTVEIQDERRRALKTEVRINDLKNGQYQISYWPKHQGRYSVIIKVNGEHVDGSPFTLLVKPCEQAVSSGNLSARGKNSEGHSLSQGASRYFSPELGACTQVGSVKPFQCKLVSRFGKYGSSVRMFNGPWGVAVSNTDEIAVTDCFNHRVQLFDRSGAFLKCFGHEGTNQGIFSLPRGICFDKNGNIYIADSSDNSRIQIFSREGRYIGEFGKKGSHDNQLCNPWGLSLDASGNIIVADAGNKLIKIFTTDGQFVRKIGGPGCFSFPVHCVQCDEYFIVSDGGEHCIKVFSRKGKFQFKFGQQGERDGEFHGPRCLLVTKSKQVMACDMDNHRVQVFDLNGRFAGKFGTKGSKLKPFNSNPTSVAVLSNGRIVVSEFSNHRIQIFEWIE